MSALALAEAQARCVAIRLALLDSTARMELANIEVAESAAEWAAATAYLAGARANLANLEAAQALSAQALSANITTKLTEQ